MSDIGAWLNGLGLGRYLELFAANEIDLDALPNIGEDDMKEIGIALGPRRKILAAIHDTCDLGHDFSPASRSNWDPKPSGAERS